MTHMDDPALDDLLLASAPAGRSASPRVDAELGRVVAEARVEARTAASAPRTHRRRRLWWLALPVLALPAVGLVTTASTEPRLVPDFTIPLSYTTDTGRSIQCTLGFYNGEIDYQESSFAAVDWLKTQNWNGVGQRVYERALSYETDVAWLHSDVNADGALDARTVQYRAFLEAEGDEILNTLDDTNTRRAICSTTSCAERPQPTMRPT